MMLRCEGCDGEMWVCEPHQMPFESCMVDSDCDGPGEPCPMCHPHSGPLGPDHRLCPIHTCLLDEMAATR